MKYCKGSLVGIVLVLGSGASNADLMVKEKQHTAGYKMMGKQHPAEEKVITYWIGEDRMRSEGGKEDILVLLDKNQIIVIDHEKKRFSEIPPEVFQNSGPSNSASEDLPPGLGQFMSNMMKMSVSVEPTSETAQIGKWTARKYLQTLETGMSKSTSEVWATTELKIAPELASRYAAAFYGRSGQMKDMMGNLLKEMEKIDGYVVKTVTKSTVMKSEVNSSTEVLEINEQAMPPQGIYEVPAKYKKKKWAD